MLLLTRRSQACEWLRTLPGSPVLACSKVERLPLRHRQKRVLSDLEKPVSHTLRSSVHCCTSSLEKREVIRSNFKIAPKTV